jgi:hypothetical protein
MGYGLRNSEIEMDAANPPQAHTPPFHFVRRQKKGEAAGLAAKNLVGPLTRSGNRLCLDVDAAAAFIENNLAIRESEQSPITTGANILTGDKFGAALTHKNAAGGYCFATITFYTETLADAITTVPDATLTFFMCHKLPYLPSTRL